MAAKNEIPSDRYSQRVLAQRVDEARRQAGLSIRELCDKVGWHKSVYTRKINHQRNPLFIPECERLASALRKPDGWPFVSATEAELLEAHREGRARIVKTP